MPTYEYECGACGHHFEQFQGINESPVSECPECHGARLNSVARAVRLGLGAQSSSPARKTPSSKPAARELNTPTIETFSALDIAAAAQFLSRLKLDSRSAASAR